MLAAHLPFDSAASAVNSCTKIGTGAFCWETRFGQEVYKLFIMHFFFSCGLLACARWPEPRQLCTMRCRCCCRSWATTLRRTTARRSSCTCVPRCITTR